MQASDLSARHAWLEPKLWLPRTGIKGPGACDPGPQEAEAGPHSPLTQGGAA